MRYYEHGGDIYAGERKLLDFSVNINPLGMPQQAALAANRSVQQDITYPDPFCRRLTEALSKRYGVPAENTVCGNGASDLILRLCAAVRPERVLVPAPGFSEYGRSSALFGAEVLEYSVSGLCSAPPLLDILCGAGEGDFGIVFVCRPNNPDGSIMGMEDLIKAAQECERTGALLAVDECFLEFTRATSALAVMSRYRSIVVLNAFTKTYAMAGLRLGFMFSADTALADEVYRFASPWSVSAPAQAAGTVCCGLTDYLKDSRNYIGLQRKSLSSCFEKFGLKVFPSEANFLLVKEPEGLRKTPGGADPRSLREELFCRGIKVRDCRSFSGLNDSCIRVGVRTKEENSALIGALEDIYG